MNEFSTLLALLERPETFPAALATLVEVSGSSYRRAGARLLLAADGTPYGTLSGGCLEADVIARCARVRETGRAELATYDTREENDLVWGVGLGCHGVVRILIEPLPVRPDWVDGARAAAQARRDFRLHVAFGPAAADPLGTACPANGPAAECPDPRQMAPNSTRHGRRVPPIAVPPPALPPEPLADCFVDVIPPAFRLLVFGAGEDARPLVRFGAALGWEVSVLDPRPSLPTPDRFPDAIAWHAGPVETLLARVSGDTRTGAVIMTHHYVHDLPLLAGLRCRPLAYLGLLGPRARAERLLRDSNPGAGTSAAIGREDNRLHAPVGLDLGGDGPAAVALSIVSEIQCRLSGRDGRPLRERSQPIHPR